MTPKEAVAARDALAAQLDHVQDRREGLSARLVLVTGQRRTVEANLAEAHIAEARGITDAAADVERLRAERDKVTAEFADLTEEIKLGAEASKRVVREREKLHKDERDAFIEYAEGFTAAAHEALEALREPYAAAIEAWGEARAAWAPLCRDVDDLSHPPLAPMLNLVEVFHGHAQARPVELAQPVDDSAITFEPGTIRLWENDDAETMASVYDSEFDRHLATEPRWRLTGVRQPVEA